MDSMQEWNSVMPNLYDNMKEDILENLSLQWKSLGLKVVLAKTIEMFYNMSSCVPQ